MRNLPDIVIGGAHKCGTSSLFYALCEHPQIIGAEPKETFFFMDADHPLRSKEGNLHDDGSAAYQNYFPEESPEPSLWLDATTHYLYSDTARRAFAQGPNPRRVCFFLREPAARIYSSYQYTANNLGRLKRDIAFEDIADLMLNDRMDEIANEFTHEGSFYVMKRELAYSRYIDYLRLWKQDLGSERIMVYQFEDFIRRPDGVLKEICDGLGIASAVFDGYHLEKANETVSIKNKRIHNLLSTLKAYIPENIRSSWLKSIYLGMQSKGSSNTDDKANALTMLKPYFVEANEALSNEFGIDLNLWK